jgi:hypothetical protein
MFCNVYVSPCCIYDGNDYMDKSLRPFAQLTVFVIIGSFSLKTVIGETCFHNYIGLEHSLKNVVVKKAKTKH